MTVVPPSRSLVSSVWERALDLVFPPRCVSCADYGAFLCDGCQQFATSAEEPRCPVCWVRSEGTCGDCRYHPPAFRAARSVFTYEGPIRDAVLALKFRGISSMAPLIGRLMANRLSEWNPPIAAIAPVPLSGSRKRARGYDQALLLAREVSRRTGIALEARALVRRAHIPPQAQQPGREERRQNVRDAFANRKAVTGGLLLIDDVMTTGATLDACARVLREGGAGAIFALTFARED